MKRYITILNGGSLAGAIAFVLFLLFYYAFGINPLGGIKFLALAVPAVLMYFSMKRFKETEGEGFLSYGKGFSVGVMFTFIYASLSAMLVYLFGLLVDQGFVSFFINENLSDMGEAKDQMISVFGEGVYKEAIEEIQKVDLGDLAFGDFQSKAIAGIIITLIVAAIHKKNPPKFEESEA